MVNGLQSALNHPSVELRGRIVPSVASPVLGACLLALRQLGLQVEPDALRRAVNQLAGN